MNKLLYIILLNFQSQELKKVSHKFEIEKAYFEEQLNNSK